MSRKKPDRAKRRLRSSARPLRESGRHRRRGAPDKSPHEPKPAAKRLEPGLLEKSLERRPPEAGVALRRLERLAVVANPKMEAEEAKRRLGTLLILASGAALFVNQKRLNEAGLQMRVSGDPRRWKTIEQERAKIRGVVSTFAYRSTIRKWVRSGKLTIDQARAIRDLPQTLALFKELLPDACRWSPKGREDEVFGRLFSFLGWRHGAVEPLSSFLQAVALEPSPHLSPDALEKRRQHLRPSSTQA